MEMKQNHKVKEFVMSYEETEIPVVSLHITQLISDRARTPSHCQFHAVSSLTLLVSLQQMRYLPSIL